nr:MAG TPA: hypothetical protein [Bacteriophage sp.]
MSLFCFKLEQNYSLLSLIIELSFQILYLPNFIMSS